MLNSIRFDSVHEVECYTSSILVGAKYKNMDHIYLLSNNKSEISIIVILWFKDVVLNKKCVRSLDPFCFYKMVR